MNKKSTTTTFTKNQSPSKPPIRINQEQTFITNQSTTHPKTLKNKPISPKGKPKEKEKEQHRYHKISSLGSLHNKKPDYNRSTENHNDSANTKLLQQRKQSENYNKQQQ